MKITPNQFESMRQVVAQAEIDRCKDVTILYLALSHIHSMEGTKDFVEFCEKLKVSKHYATEISRVKRMVAMIAEKGIPQGLLP